MMVLIYGFLLYCSKYVLTFSSSIYCRTYDTPKLIESFENQIVVEISCGSAHSAAVTDEGELYTWGLGEYGRLGHGDTERQLKPRLVRYASC